MHMLAETELPVDTVHMNLDTVDGTAAETAVHPRAVILTQVAVQVVVAEPIFVYHTLVILFHLKNGMFQIYQMNMVKSDI